MASISKYDYLTATVNGVRYEFGSMSVPQVITAAGDDAYVYTATVAVSTAITVWNAVTSPPAVGPSDFDLLLLASDYDLDVELTSGFGTAKVRYANVELLGSGTTGTWGPPFVLYSDDTMDSDYTSAWGAGAADTFDVIKVKNQSSTQAAQMLVMIFT